MCPDEAVCSEGATLATLEIKPKHYRFSTSAKTIYECPLGKEACPGSPTNGTRGAVGSDPLCAAEYTGYLCYGAWVGVPRWGSQTFP